MARKQFQTLSEPMYYVLLSLTEECCGVDIMKKVDFKWKNSCRAWNLIYST